MLTIQLFTLKDSVIALSPMLDSLNTFMSNFAKDLYNAVSAQEENEENIQNQIESVLNTWFSPNWDTAFQELPTWCEDFGDIFITYGETSIVNTIGNKQTQLDYDLNQFLDQLTAYTIEIGKISSKLFFFFYFRN